MIKVSPFHARTVEANQTGLWSHWAGYLAADRYQMSDKLEYFAFRNAAGLFDTSPLYKYRIRGADAERYLAGVLARDIRRCKPGQAQYTIWCDDDGWVLEDGVVLRHSRNDFLLTTAKPNLFYFHELIGDLEVGIEDVSEELGALALQGPRSRRILEGLAAEVEELAYFHVVPTKIGDAPVTISRTGYTGDLGYEIWVSAEDAVPLWDDLMEAGHRHGAVPCGQDALLTTRIEAGLLLIDVDFQSARFAWNDDQRMTPLELGLGWMLRGIDDGDRAFIGRDAILREIADKSTRWTTTGIVVDWEDWGRAHDERGLVTPKDHTPEHGVMMIYDGHLDQIGYVTSFVYSPVLQRHLGIARLRPDHGAAGTSVQLEVTIDHRYDVVEAVVAQLPLYDPPRRTA